MESGSWYSQNRSRNLPRNEGIIACFIGCLPFNGKWNLENGTKFGKSWTAHVICNNAQRVPAGSDVQRIPPFLTSHIIRSVGLVAVGLVVDKEFDTLDRPTRLVVGYDRFAPRSEEHTSAIQSLRHPV